MMSETNMNNKTSEKVQIMFSKLIKPSSQTPDHLRIRKFSSIDQLSPTCHMGVLFFYAAVEKVDMGILSSRLEQLEKSLSETLSVYYPLAGRFAADALSVECEDQGVLYIAAKVSCQLNHFLDEASKDVDLLNSLAPGSTVEDSAPGPLVRVQVCIFECGGIALAVETHHHIADGFTAFAFVDLWAKMNRCDTSEAKLPSFFDSSAIWPPLDIPTTIKDKTPTNPGEKIVAKRLLLDGAAIARLKDEVMARASGMDGQPSRVEIVTAFVWRCLIRAAQTRHGYLRPSMISFPLNLRGKTAAGVPENGFGNAYIPVPIKFMADESKMELHFFARLIRDAIRKTLRVCAKASKDELSSMCVRGHEEVREWWVKDEVDLRVASSLCRFPVYEADFGWGKPYWLSLLRWSFQAFLLMETKCGTGIEVVLTLNEIEMQKLEADPFVAPFISSKNLNLENSLP